MNLELIGLRLRKYIELRENWAADNYSGPSANISKLKNSCCNVCNGPWSLVKYGITKDAYIALQILVRGAQVLWLVCSLCESLCLSLREDISETTRAIFTKFLVHVAYGCGSIFLRRRGRSLLSTTALLYVCGGTVAIVICAAITLWVTGMIKYIYNCIVYSCLH